MKLISTLAFAIMFSMPVLARADNAAEEQVRNTLFARYDQKNVSVVAGKILVAPLAEGAGFSGRGKNQLEYSVNYDYFDPHVSKQAWPKKYQKRNLLDENTTEEVEATAKMTDAVSPGEMLQVRLFYVNWGQHGGSQIDFYLVPLSGKRLASSQNLYPEGGGVTYKIDWGCHFRFNFPPKAPGASTDAFTDYLIDQIGHYFIPTEAYLRVQRKGAKTVDLSVVPGKYFDEKRPWDFVELKPDKAYVVRYEGQDYKGTYELSGNALTFIPATGERSTARLAGNLIVGLRTWVKQGAPEDASTTQPVQRAQVLTDDDIIKLHEANLADGVIISKINNSGCNFDTSTEMLVRLKAAGVPDPVVQAMIECHRGK